MNAFSFRFSNYFILFTSNSLCILNNIKHCGKKNDLVYPLEVELPHSLIHVVTNWNLPMHFWLKTCKKSLFPSF
jgi:porcupine-like protein